jgi:hypothetical protein
MFEVTKYDPPLIFVTCRRTGETHKLLVGSDRALAHDGVFFDRGDVRRAAITYLALRPQTNAGEFVDERAPPMMSEEIAFEESSRAVSGD